MPWTSHLLSNFLAKRGRPVAHLLPQQLFKFCLWIAIGPACPSFPGSSRSCLSWPWLSFPVPRVRLCFLPLPLLFPLARVWHSDSPFAKVKLFGLPWLFLLPNVVLFTYPFPKGLFLNFAANFSHCPEAVCQRGKQFEQTICCSAIF